MNKHTTLISSAAAIFAVGISAAGCGGGSSGSYPATRSVSGSVVAGYVSGASVRVYRVEADRSLTYVGEAQSDGNGRYELQVSGEGPFYVVAGGGSYRDEASGNSRSLGALPAVNALTSLDQTTSGVLSAMVGSGAPGQTLSLTVTPMTTVAARRTIEASRSDPAQLTETMVAATNTQLAAALGVTGDPRQLTPLDFTNPADASGISADPDSPGSRLGALLAGLSQSAEDQGLTDPLELVDALALDYADGTMDGQSGSTQIQVGGSPLATDAGTSGLVSAVQRFLDDPQVNASGTTASDFQALVDAVGTTTPDPAPAPAPAPATLAAPPSFAAISSQQVTVGVGVSLPIVLDPSPHTVSVSAAVVAGGAGITGLNIGVGAGGTGGSGVSLSFLPTSAGSITIRVVAQDDGGTAGRVDTFVEDVQVTIVPPTGAGWPAVPTWHFRVNSGSLLEFVNDIAPARDGSGDLLVVGHVYAGSTTRDDAFLIRVDRTGTILWRKDYTVAGSQGFSAIATDDAGAIYVVGATETEFAGLTPAGVTDVMLLKLDALGEIEWGRLIGSPALEWDPVLSVHGQGNDAQIVVGGMTQGDIAGIGYGGGNDSFVARFDASGNRAWIKQFATAGDDAVDAVDLDAAGNAYVAVMSEGPLFQPLVGVKDVAVVSYAPDGAQRWVKHLASQGTDWAFSVNVDGGGAIYVTGATDGDLGGPNAGGQDAYVARFQSDGTLSWINQFGTPEDDWARDGMTDGNELVVAGYTHGALDGPNAGDDNDPDTRDPADGFARRFDASGALLVGQQFGSAGTDYVFDATLGEDGDLYAIGCLLGGSQRSVARIGSVR